MLVALLVAANLAPETARSAINNQKLIGFLATGCLRKDMARYSYKCDLDGGSEKRMT